jgi:hypothetical protein
MPADAGMSLSPAGANDKIVTPPTQRSNELPTSAHSAPRFSAAAEKYLLDRM